MQNLNGISKFKTTLINFTSFQCTLKVVNKYFLNNFNAGIWYVVQRLCRNTSDENF